MGRDLSAAARTESRASVVRPVQLVKMRFDGGDMRLWSGLGDLVWNAEIYRGVGRLGRIGAVGEGVEPEALGISLELSGIDPALLATALAEDVQGRALQVWQGFIDQGGGLVADPVLAFQGRMDTMDVSLGETATVTLRGESRLIDWDRPRVRRYTDADQQARFPGDRGLEFVNDTVEKPIFWGQTMAGGRGGGTVAAGQGSAGARPMAGGRGRSVAEGGLR